MVEVGIEGSLPMAARGPVHLVAHVGGHLVHEVLPVVRMVVVLGVDEGVFVVSGLLVPVQVILQVTLPDPEDHIQTRSKMVLAENLSLLQHLEIAAQGEEAVAACLMLWTDPIAANLIA